MPKAHLGGLPLSARRSKWSACVWALASAEKHPLARRKKGRPSAGMGKNSSLPPCKENDTFLAFELCVELSLGLATVSGLLDGCALLLVILW